LGDIVLRELARGENALVESCLDDSMVASSTWKPSVRKARKRKRRRGRSGEYGFDIFSYQWLIGCRV
jgi:hypothetical protein